MKESLFPQEVRNLPVADIPLPGVNAWLSQGAQHQIVFMSFDKTVELPEHSHEIQWGVVPEGRVDLTIGGNRHSFRKGDRYFIPEGVVHSGLIHGGYADITFFDTVSRYAVR